MSYAIAGLLVTLAVLCGRSLKTGRGWPARTLLRVYYGIGSLESFQKTGNTYRSATDVVASGGEPFLGALVRRVASPSWLVLSARPYGQSFRRNDTAGTIRDVCPSARLVELGQSPTRRACRPLNGRVRVEPSLTLRGNGA